MSSAIVRILYKFSDDQLFGIWYRARITHRYVLCSANDLFRRRVIIPENYSSSLKFGDPLINSRVPKNGNGTIRKFVVSLQLSYENEYEVDQHSTDQN